jgi:cell division protease FtsH
VKEPHRDRPSEVRTTSRHPAEAGTAPPQKLAYSDLLNRVNAGHVTSVSINNLGAVTGQLDKGGQFTSQIPTALTTGTSELQQALLGHHVKITGKQASNSGLVNILLSFLRLLVIIGLFVWSGRAARRSLGAGIGGIGRSRAKITDAERPTTRFSDVAGYDGAKQEITSRRFPSHP